MCKCVEVFDFTVHERLCLVDVKKLHFDLTINEQKKPITYVHYTVVHVDLRR